MTNKENKKWFFWQVKNNCNGNIGLKNVFYIEISAHYLEFYYYHDINKQ